MLEIKKMKIINRETNEVMAEWDYPGDEILVDEIAIDKDYKGRIQMTLETYFDGLKKIFEQACEIPNDEENCCEFQKAKDNTVKQFKEWGIDILDDKGYLKSFNWIIVDVAKIYPSMSDEDKEFCLELLCGKRETSLKYVVRRHLEGTLSGRLCTDQRESPRDSIN